jgi:hypothetical protein
MTAADDAPTDGRALADGLGNGWRDAPQPIASGAVWRAHL